MLPPLKLVGDGAYRIAPREDLTEADRSGYSPLRRKTNGVLLSPTHVQGVHGSVQKLCHNLATCNPDQGSIARKRVSSLAKTVLSSGAIGSLGRGGAERLKLCVDAFQMNCWRDLPRTASLRVLLFLRRFVVACLATVDITTTTITCWCKTHPSSSAITYPRLRDLVLSFG